MPIAYRLGVRETGDHLCRLQHALAAWPVGPEYAESPAGRFLQRPDELCLAEIFHDYVEDLLASDYDFAQENFYSADLAERGKMFANEAWTHPSGSTLVGWVKHCAASPIVCLQCADGLSADDNPHFQRRLENVIHWAGSAEAADWSRQRQLEE